MNRFRLSTGSLYDCFIGEKFSIPHAPLPPFPFEAAAGICGYDSPPRCGCRKKEHDQELGTLLTHVGGTSLEMIQSQKLPRDNTTGYKGVYLVRGKYLAKIVFQKKQYFLGTYDSIEEAAAARKSAEALLFGETAAFIQ